MSAQGRNITSVAGRPIPLRGNEIDTDQIIPARFMTAVTFDGMGQHAFQDLRFDPNDGRQLDHPMNDPKYEAKGPRVAIVNKNFGCGSSREHAPQALWRWGIHAIVGESFADIFFNNCVSMGIPCVEASEGDVHGLMEAVEADPAHDLTVDLETMTVQFKGQRYDVKTYDGARHRLRTGTWDATGLLVDALEDVKKTAANLPYTEGFKS